MPPALAGNSYYWATRKCPVQRILEGQSWALYLNWVWLCCRRYGGSHQMAGLPDTGSQVSRRQQQPCGTQDEAGGLHPGCWGCCCSCVACSGGWLLQESQEMTLRKLGSYSMGLVPWMLICGVVVTKLVLQGPRRLHTLAVQLRLSLRSVPIWLPPQTPQYTNTHDGTMWQEQGKKLPSPPGFSGAFFCQSPALYSSREKKCVRRPRFHYRRAGTESTFWAEKQ